MYLGIDVGGTKTIVADLDENGVILESQKIQTAKDYQDFLSNLAASIVNLSTKNFRAGAAGIPATSMLRSEGIGVAFGNLDWRNVPIQADLETILNCPVVIENDAKLAGLSESMLRPDSERLLYVTISTGIGYSLIVNHKIDDNIGDAGGRLMIFEHRGKLTPWEDFASGRAIVEIFGKQAHEIEDKLTWEKIARNLSIGLVELIAVTEPNLIVFGGSVGVYFDRFKEPLFNELKKLETPLLMMPDLEGAKRPEEAVIYGCYDYIKQVIN